MCKGRARTAARVNGNPEEHIATAQLALAAVQTGDIAGALGHAAELAALDAATLLRARLERLRKAREAAAASNGRKPVGKAALKALETLGLDETADKAAIRRQFKDLAKRLHPDLNEGDRSREDKLRAIIDAYNYLKSAGLA